MLARTVIPDPEFVQEIFKPRMTLQPKRGRTGAEIISVRKAVLYKRYCPGDRRQRRDIRKWHQVAKEVTRWSILNPEVYATARSPRRSALPAIPNRKWWLKRRGSAVQTMKQLSPGDEATLRRTGKEVIARERIEARHVVYVMAVCTG